MIFHDFVNCYPSKIINFYILDHYYPVYGSKSDEIYLYAMGPIWNTGGTETIISVPVSVLGPQRAGSGMGCIQRNNLI